MKKSFVKSQLKPKREKFNLALMMKLIILWLVVLTGSISLTIWFSYQQPLVSPINQFSQFHFIHNSFPIQKNHKLVYGFLPYWNMNHFQPKKGLDRLVYFALAIKADGQIAVSGKNGQNKPAPGFQRLQSDQFLTILDQLGKNKTRVDLVFSLFDGQTAKHFLRSNKAQAEFLKNLDSLILAYPISGINLDVEIPAKTGYQLRKEFSQFVTKLSQHLARKPEKINLSLDVYAGAANKPYIWDLKALAPKVDHIILMAYDFHRANSTTAGPVAPIFSQSHQWANDISSYLKQTLQLVPAQKLILGIPFYGYRWQTVDRSAQAQTFPQSGKSLTYAQITQLLTQPNPSLKKRWNQTALSPYISYQKDGKTYIIYYDNPRSIKYKLELVKQLDLAGVAIWALGYEDKNGTLWQVINQNLNY